MLDKLNFKDLGLLKGLKVLGKMKLDKEVLDIINMKKKSDDEEKE